MLHLPKALRTPAAALLLAAGRCAFAAAPEPLTDELLASLQAAYARAVVPGDEAELHRGLLDTLLRRVQRSHATEADFAGLAAAAAKVLDPLPAASGEPAEVFRKAMNAALRSMDPYARYIDARSWQAERSDASGSFVGLGIEVEAAAGLVRVVAPIAGGPAARAGLKAGDFIVQVNGEPLQGVALADAIARMRGDVGTKVSITVRREGADEFEVSLTRDTIRRQLLRWRMEDGALVLRLSSFSGPVGTALADAVTEATATHQPRAVVLDLRGNPGGLLREAVRVADAFLAKGEITSVRGRTPASQRSWQADADEVLAGLPMVVLVDQRSASASELVAAALQENGRATVMGQRSFGKGSVQTTYSLGEGKGAVKLTTSLYYGPLGRTVNKAGVTPDVELVAAPPAPGEATGAADAPQPAVRVPQGRCGAVVAVNDAGLSCALAFLRAGNLDAFAGLAP